MSRQKKPIRTRAAFTVLEIFVTIAILAIMAALLLPMANSLRRAALSAQCQSNLRQLGLAMRLYAQENNRKFPVFSDEPRAPGTPSRTHVFEKLAPYLGINYSGSFGPKNIRGTVCVCPASPFPANIGYTALGSTTYGINSTISPYWGFTAWNYALDVPKPASTFLIVEKNSGWYEPFSISSTGGPGSPETRIVHPGHSANYLFVDGHVENIQGPYPPPEDERWYRKNPGGPL